MDPDGGMNPLKPCAGLVGRGACRTACVDVFIVPGQVQIVASLMVVEGVGAFFGGPALHLLQEGRFMLGLLASAAIGSTV